jgi:hypothetical protein
VWRELSNKPDVLTSTLLLHPLAYLGIILTDTLENKSEHSVCFLHSSSRFQLPYAIFIGSNFLPPTSHQGWKEPQLENIVHRVLGFTQKTRFLGKVF